MDTQYLALTWNEGASPNEIQSWQQLQVVLAKDGIICLTVETRAELDREIDRLISEGWTIVRNGSGVFWRILNLQRKSTN